VCGSRRRLETLRRGRWVLDHMASSLSLLIVEGHDTMTSGEMRPVGEGRACGHAAGPIRGLKDKDAVKYG